MKFKALLLCGGLLAPSAVLAQSALLHAANNTSLAAIKSTSKVVLRDGFAAAGDSPPVQFVASNAPCSLNSGAGDGGSQIPTADGKCWIANLGVNGADVRTFGTSYPLNVYVSATGTDSGYCQSIGVPCRTINYALAQGLKSDTNGGTLTVNIGAGTFSENITVNGQARGAVSTTGFVSAASIPLVKLLGAGSASTTIAGGQVVGGQSYCYAVLANAFGQVALSGLTVTANAGGSGCGQSDIYAQFFGAIYILSDVVLGASNGPRAFAEEHGAIIVTPGCGGSCSGALTFAGSATTAVGLSDNSTFQSDSTIAFTGSPVFSVEAFLAEGNSTIKLAGNPPTTGAFTGRLALLMSNATMLAYFSESWPGSISSCSTGARMQGIGGPPGCAFATPVTLPGGVSAYNPTGTTSTAAYLMMGLGAAGTPTVFKPGISGAVDVSFAGSLANSTSGDGAQTTIFYGTGTPPANGAAISGSNCGAANPRAVSASANNFLPFAVRCTITGLTPGTQYWFDLGLAALTGGTASIANTTFTAVELPQ